MLGLFSGLMSWFGEGSSALAGSIIGTPPRVISETGWINNASLESTRLRLVRAVNWMSSSATAATDALMVPGLTGGRGLPLRSTQPLQLSIEGNFLEVEFDDRIRIANAFADALRGLLEIRFADAPDVVLRGTAGPAQFASLTEKQFVPSVRSAVVKVTVPISCIDSARYARHARQIVIDQTPAPIPLGSLASGGDYYVLGPLTGALDIDLIAPSGQRLYRHALRSIDIPDEGYLQMRWDAPHAMLVYDEDGAATSVSGWRDLTLSSRYWQPSPTHGDPQRGIWAMLRQSAGFGLYRYHQAWEH